MRALRYAPLFLPLLAGCVFVHAEGDGHDHASSLVRRGKRASATIEPRSGSSTHGTATFTEVDGGVLVEITLKGTTPGWHAVHVHETGDCSAPDGTSAGGHFNPGGHAHGSPMAPEHHAGDLGSVFVAEDGTARHVLLMPELTVADGTHSVRGRSIIVHASGDDYTTQPTGNAGGRIGCGVIR